MSAMLIPNASPQGEDTGVRLWRWTPESYQRAITLGWFAPSHTRLIDGEVYLETPVSSANGGHAGNELILWRFDRSHYYAAGENGIFAPEARLELIFGRVYLQLPHGDLHAMGIDAAVEAVRAAFPTNFYFREQRPLSLSADGAPEPDLLVVPGTWRDYVHAPMQDDVALLVEIPDTTLRYDRTEKAALYAEAGIADYWISNLQKSHVGSSAQPVSHARQPFRFWLSGRNGVHGRRVHCAACPAQHAHSRRGFAAALPARARK